MLSLLAAISSASKSGVSLAYAFFDPSGLMRVLILTVSTSYNDLSAAFICGLVALYDISK